MSIKEEAIETLIANINRIKIRRVGEDLNEPATIKDLEACFQNNQDWKQYLNLKNCKRAVFTEDWDYYIVVTFPKKGGFKRIC